MALEAISKIQEAEQKAAKIIEDANNESKVIISSAQLKADSQFNDIIEKTKEAAKVMKDNSLQEGLLESQPILDRGKKEVDEILNTPKNKVDAAVNLVVERIVKFNGNS